MRKDVVIKATKNVSSIHFDMEQGNQYTEILVFNKTNDKIPKNEDYDIDFELKNVSGANLEFLQDEDEVIWISKGSDTHLPKCPKNNNGNPNTPFTVTSLSATKLTVKNTDNDICFYKFALRFRDKDTGNVLTYDPIFGNQNGGLTVTPPGGGGTISSGVAFVGGLLVGAVGFALVNNAGLLG